MTLKISRNFLKPVIVLGGVLLFAIQGTAGVSSFYKWKDDQGKVHFTDDPLKIPSQYRSPARVEKRRGLPPPKWEPAETRVPVKKEKKDDGIKKVSEEEQKAMREALGFLKNDIQRYKKYDDYIPAVRHARVLTNDIVAALPAKEALGEKLEEYDSALLSEIKNFIKKSLRQDYLAKDLWPRRRGFVEVRLRLAGEVPEKEQLIEKLEAELASLPEPAASKPPPSTRKESGVKNPEIGKEENAPGDTEKY